MEAWALAHPWMTFFLLPLVISIPFRIVNRVIRHFNLRANGWPPPHCDADGELREED
jgi:hypothetical protein